MFEWPIPLFSMNARRSELEVYVFFIHVFFEEFVSFVVEALETGIKSARFDYVVVFLVGLENSVLCAAWYGNSI